MRIILILIFRFIPTQVDIEKPEFESESFRVFIFRPLRVQENLRVTSVQLPVHLRYHKPSSVSTGVSVAGGSEHQPSTPMAMVKITNPRLMLSCGDEDLLLNCSSRRVTSYCDETGEYETVSTYLILILCFSRSRQV